MVSRFNRIIQKHDDLVYNLYDIILNQNKYRDVVLFYEYFNSGLKGEVDLLGILESNLLDFYEVKTNYSNKSMKKAREQYKRFREAFPNVNDGFYYSSDGLIRRLKND